MKKDFTRKFDLQVAAVIIGGLLVVWYFKRWPELFYACGAIVLLSIIPYTSRLLTKAWMGLGEVMGRIVCPIVLGTVWFVILTPIAFFYRLSGKDPMGLKVTGSTWKERSQVFSKEDLEKPF